MKCAVNTKKSNKYCYLINILMTGLCFAVLLKRIQYGTNLYDEAWYVAEPTLASYGALPYSEIWTQSPGVCFPLFIIYKLFIYINNGTVGIFLFSKTIYIIWLFIVLLTVHHIHEEIPYMICLPILFFSPHTLFYIDYNTIGPVYLFLSTLLVLCNTDESKRKARGFISGVLAARGIIGTPYIIASLLLLILILLVKRNWIQILYFSLGVFLFSSVAVIYFSSHRGLKNLINGILYIIYQQGYTDKLSQLNRHFVGIQVIEFLIPFFVIMIIGALIYMLFHESNYKIYCILIKMCAFISASIAIVFGLLSFPVSVYRNDFENYIKYSWFISLFIMTFNKNSRRGQHRFNLFYPILAITQYMFTCFYNITGAIEREYILYFCTVISFWMLIKYCSIPDACYFYKLKVEIVSAIMCIVLSKIVYTYVYINTNIQQLNSYIASGVYKGCYSDTSTASFIITVEERIKKYTSKGETVAFVDNIPYAYLMSNSYPFTATTLGETKRNGLEYYHLEKRNPDKIIYLNGSLTKDEYDKFVRNNYFLEYYDNWASNTMEVYQIKK